MLSHALTASPLILQAPSWWSPKPLESAISGCGSHHDNLDTWAREPLLSPQSKSQVADTTRCAPWSSVHGSCAMQGVVDEAREAGRSGALYTLLKSLC